MMHRFLARLALVPAALAAFLMAFAGPVFAGQPVDGGLDMQDPASPTMTQIKDFHHVLHIISAVIVIFVLALLVIVMLRYNKRANPTAAHFHHNTLLEVVWTAIPIAILVGIAIPSFNLLRFLETVHEADLTIKAIGQNWYWDYEYPDHGAFAFTSRMLDKETALARGLPYRLATDYNIVVPVGATVRVEVTAGDRLHAFAVPALGIKIDAVPGRLNDTWFKAEKEGIFYGQCSELCGAYHAYMPIAVEVVSAEQFNQWTERMKTEFGSNEPDAASKVAALPETR